MEQEKRDKEAYTAEEIQKANKNEELIEPETSFDESKTQDEKPCDDAYGLENQNTSEIEKRARELARQRA